MMTPEPVNPQMPQEDREFYIEFGASTALALAIVLLI
jgi:hypothetical protein